MFWTCRHGSVIGIQRGSWLQQSARLLTRLIASGGLELSTVAFPVITFSGIQFFRYSVFPLSRVHHANFVTTQNPKSHCHKTNLGNYFDDPTLPTRSLRCTCVYIAARRLDYCIQEADLSQRAAKYSLHSSVKLSRCSPELDFTLPFCNILGEWTWPYLWNTREKSGIIV